MEADCQYDFNVAMAVAASLQPITNSRALGNDPLVVAIDGTNFAVDGAVVVDGTIRASIGDRVQTTTVFDRPLRVDIVAKQSQSGSVSSTSLNAMDPGCLHFNVFPQDATDRFSGYVFGEPLLF